MTAGAAVRAAPFVVLAVALAAVSHGAIFARLAAAAPVAIAAWRVTIAFAVVLPFAIAGARRTRPGARPLALAAGAGALLAVHFATWIESLAHTSIARSVLLVSTSPLWVALFHVLAGRGWPSRRTLLALGLAMAGLVVVSRPGQGASDAWTGDLLALAGGAAMAGYLWLSRAAQARLAFLPYLGAAYGTAAVLLALAVAATGTEAFGFDGTTWAALAGMALVSQLVGHSGYNWSLRHLNPLFVAVVSVGEPVLASLLGWWLLGEAVDRGTAAGGVLILAGIALATGAARNAG